MFVLVLMRKERERQDTGPLYENGNKSRKGRRRRVTADGYFGRRIQALTAEGGIVLLAQGDRDVERIESLGNCMCASSAGLPITGWPHGWMD